MTLKCYLYSKNSPVYVKNHLWQNQGHWLYISLKPKRKRLHIWHAYWNYEKLSNDTKVNDLVTLIFMLNTRTLRKSERAPRGTVTMAVTFVADNPDPEMSSRFLTSLYRILNMYVINHSRYIVSSWPWLLTFKFIDIFLSWSCVYS